MAHVGKGRAEGEMFSVAIPCCGRPLPTHTGSLKSKIRRPGYTEGTGEGKRERETDRHRQLMWSQSGA